jgi:hypothetical protein
VYEGSFFPTCLPIFVVWILDDTGWLIVLACSGCHNKIPQRGWLKPQKNSFSHSSGVWKAGIRMVDFWWRFFSWLADGHFLPVSSRGKESKQDRKSFVVFFLQGHNFYWISTPSSLWSHLNLTASLESPLQVQARCGLGLQYVNLGQGVHNFQYIALIKLVWMLILQSRACALTLVFSLITTVCLHLDSITNLLHEMYFVCLLSIPVE